MDEALRRRIGREAADFCPRCPALEERIRGEQTMLLCRSAQCRLWAFLGLFGLRPGADFDAPTADEGLRQAHAREVRRFRGPLPVIRPDHNWDADARFNDLADERRPAQRGGPGDHAKRGWG